MMFAKLRALPLVLVLAPVSAAAQMVQPLPGATPTAADQLATVMRRVASNPRDVTALVAAGELSLQLGDLAAAASLFARADKIDARNARVKAGMATLLVRSERPGEALRLFQLAETFGIDQAQVGAERGLAFDLVGEQERAQRDYRAALRRGADDETIRRYALSLGISGRKDAALEQLEPLIRRSDRGAWRARAFILAMSGDTGEADRIAVSMMPGLAAGLHAFFERLPSLPAPDRAFAVHFGEVRATPARIADARLTPVFAPLPPEPGVALAAATPVPAAVVPPAAQRNTRDDRRSRREARSGRRATPAAASAPVQVAANAAPTTPGGTPAAASTRTPPASPAIARTAAPSPVSAGTALPRPAPTSAAPPTLASARTGAAPVTSRPPTPSERAAMERQWPSRPVITGRIRPPLPAGTGPASAAPAPATVPVVTAAASAPSTTGNPGAVPAAVAPGSPASNASAADNGAATVATAPTPSRVPASSSGVRPVAPGFTAPRPLSGAPTTAAPGAVAAAPTSSAPRALAATPVPNPAPRPVAAPPPESSDSILARIVANIAIPASELGVPPLPGRAAVPVAEDGDATPPASASRSSAERPVADGQPSAADRKALADKTAAERKAAAAKAAADRKAAADKKAADRKAVADRKAAEEKRIAKADPARIWVQVAGGAFEGDLPKAWAAVRAKAPALRNRQGWTTPLRATNRVLTGPFKTAAEARALVNELARQGVSAFPFSSEAGQKVTRLGGK